MKMLQDEGFSRCGLVDIFEGGPVVKCSLGEIRSVKESVVATVAEITDGSIESESFVLSNGRQDFRACQGPLELTEAGVRMTMQHAMALHVRVGDKLRYVTPRPLRAREEAADGSEVSLY